jgi:SAM-dependent methyltransferase
MSIFGDRRRKLCPVCGVALTVDNHAVWRIPFTKVNVTELNGAYVDHLPLLTGDATIYQYSECDCRSVFLNPYEDQTESYRTSTFHEKKFEAGCLVPNMSGGFVEQYRRWIEPHIQWKTGWLLDAACGAGQYLFLAQHVQNRVAIDLSLASVSAIERNSYGKIEGQHLDLCTDEIPDPQYDFIIFSEAYEHVSEPFAAVANLTRALQPGGKMFMTAQAVAGGLPIRPEEPIYASAEGLLNMFKKLKLEPIEMKLSSGRWKILLRKENLSM